MPPTDSSPATSPAIMDDTLPSGVSPSGLGPRPSEGHVQGREAAGNELLDALAAAQSQPNELVRRREAQLECEEGAAVAFGQNERQQVADAVRSGGEGEAVAVGRLLQALDSGEEGPHHVLAAGAQFVGR